MKRFEKKRVTEDKSDKPADAEIEELRKRKVDIIPHHDHREE